MLTLERLAILQGGFRLDADLRVEAGALVAVMGPSGAGKSTLLAAIGGFVAPDSGRILWDARDLGPLSPGERPVATIFQDNNLFPHLTALQNAALGIRPSGRLSRDERARAEATLSRVGLEGMGDRRPAHLSGGQQGRVALARMLLQDRPLVMLDEPFSALGPALKAEMIDQVAGLVRAEGKTLLMVTHDPEDARRLGGQSLLVAEGRAFAPVETEALLSDPPPALRAYLG